MLAEFSRIGFQPNQDGLFFQRRSGTSLLEKVVEDYFTLDVVPVCVVNNDYSANKSSMTTCDCITALCRPFCTPYVVT